MPTVVITFPDDGTETAASVATLLGTAADTDNVDAVEYSDDGETWADVPIATGLGTQSVSWKVIDFPLVAGENTAYVRATDGLDNTSDPETVTIFNVGSIFLGSNGVHWRGQSAAPTNHWTGVDW